MSRTTAITDQTSRVLRCAYVEFALFGDGLGARALEACAPRGRRGRAGRRRSTARRARLDRATTGRCTSTARPVEADGIADAVAHHRRARACEREDALGVARALDLAPAVGTLLAAGAAPGEDPLLRWSSSATRTSASPRATGRRRSTRRWSRR